MTHIVRTFALARCCRDSSRCGLRRAAASRRAGRARLPGLRRMPAMPGAGTSRRGEVPADAVRRDSGLAGRGASRPACAPSPPAARASPQSHPLRRACDAARRAAAGRRSGCAAASSKTTFSAWAVVSADGAAEGMVTGYYEPVLPGSRTRSDRFRYPVYGVPEDLVAVDLESVNPELKGLRLRGRLEGNRLVPYWTRAEIESATPVPRAGAGVGRGSGRTVLSADPGLGPDRTRLGRAPAPGLRRPERPSLPLDGPLSRRARRDDARAGLDAGHQGLGRRQSAQAARGAGCQSELRLLPRTAGRGRQPGVARARSARSARRSPPATASRSIRARCRWARRCFSPPPCRCPRSRCSA